jgi:MYXO-CTERM domain-containing protein
MPEVGLAIPPSRFQAKEKGKSMRKTIVVGATTLTLLFGGAGVAQATEYNAPVPATTTSVAQQADQDDDGDNTGLWGLAGLLGLFGLAGLKRRRDTADRTVVRGTGTAGTGTTR